MEYPRSRPSFDVPKPEAGLAEWTSRIKALQAQVDADEEAEQKRLEDEIAASRLARMSRRSHGPGRSMDLSKNADFASALREDPAANDLKPVVDKQKSQEDALRKLMGTNSDRSSSTPRIDPPSSPAPPPPPKKPESISLAAFMGGRATGPRLNRHPPQQDAHDPTQFEQRTHTSAPHPVFGRGGVAMPGMAAKGRTSIGREDREEIGGVKFTGGLDQAAERERRTSTPGVARRYVEKIEEQTVVAPQRTGSAPGIRERTVSTPNGTPPVKASMLEAYSAPDCSRRPVSQSALPEPRSKTPISGRYTPTSAVKTPPSSPPAASRPYTPRQQTFSPSSPSKSPIATPYLARPIKPDPKPSPQAPQISASKSPSSAFLRTPVSKDPTPSISRLQGRGFVQSMVKVSTQLESATTGSGSAEKGRVSSERRKSILDRWPAASTSVSPTVSPKPIPLRKSKTIDPSVAEAITSPSAAIKLVDTGRSLKSMASLPSMSQVQRHDMVHDAPKRKKSIPDMSAEKAADLGSSSTMISYIKPMKTGDDPQPALAPPAEPPREVDELGVRTSYSSNSSSRAKTEESTARLSEHSSPSGTPLSHPTKARAKKPRKAKDTRHEDKEQMRDEKLSRSKLVAKADTLPQPSMKSALPPKPVERLPPKPSEITPQTAATPNPQITVTVEAPPEVPSPISSTEKRPSSTPRVVDRWHEQTIIGIKPMTSTRNSPHEDTSSVKHKSESNGMVGRRALPGLTGVTQAASNDIVKPSQIKAEANDMTGHRALPGPATSPIPIVPTAIPPTTPKEEKSPSRPSTPTRHTRIPSTGNRATVMDVAQALKDQRDPPHLSTAQTPSQPLSADSNVPQLDPPRSPVLSRTTRNITPPSVQVEKRKSSYEKYSAIMLPPLHEEKTPVASPAGTLSRSAVPVQSEGKELPGPASLHTEALAEKLEAISSEPATKEPENTELVRFNHVDEPLPHFDVDVLLKAHAPDFVPDADSQNISVDVMTITGSTANAIREGTDIFYDTEVLAIIYRSKSKTSGLVSTKVWGWVGNKSHVGEKEDRKLQDLAKRYGTNLVLVRQHNEPTELVYLLGGQLAVRQGTRTHWSPENTSMHLIRSTNGSVFIDELDLNVKNLCSGFSYCLSILNTLYVWYGAGSTTEERHRALEYGRRLAAKNGTVIELREGESDQDEMFWMILGDDDYAKADYWKWRSNTPSADPRIWRISVGNTDEMVQAVPSLSSESNLHSSVYVIDCVWEFFVLVGQKARGKRQDIRLALSIAAAMSAHLTASRPFAPTVHALILPTQFPADLKLNFRDFHDGLFNDGETPEHMNILSYNEALDHLQKSSWAKAALEDEDMLPLGLESTNL